MSVRWMAGWLLSWVIMDPSVAIDASGAAPVPEARQLAEQAMQRIAAEDVRGFFDLLKKKMPMPADEMKKLEEKVLSQRDQTTKALGKILGYSFVSECRRGSNLVRLIYIEKREKAPMRWLFILYKPRDQWLFSYFYWDSDVQQLFVPCD